MLQATHLPEGAGYNGARTAIAGFFHNYFCRKTIKLREKQREKNQ